MALDAFFRYVRFIPQSDATVADIAFTVRDLDYANRANRALRRPVTVSGTHADTVAKEYAVDGKNDTRWASNRNGDMWIAVDLGEEIDVDVVRVSWELAYAETYTVDLSSDGKNWTTALTVHNTGGVQQHLLPEGSRARYVRIHSLKALNQYGINIWELEVYSREDATTPEIAELKALNDACEALDTTGLSETVAATLEAALTQSAAALQLPYNAAAVQAAAAALKPAAESARRELAAARLQALCEKAAETGRGHASDMAWQFFNRQKAASEQLLANAAATADALEAQANWMDTALNVLADSAESSKALLGDVNGDGVVNTTDARLALQHAVEKISLSEAQLAVGDVDGDGIVNTTDARLILQYAVEKIDTFPVGK